MPSSKRKYGLRARRTAVRPGHLPPVLEPLADLFDLGTPSVTSPPSTPSSSRLASASRSSRPTSASPHSMRKRSRPRSASPANIDASAFPSIIDIIFRLSGRRALLKLRAASVEFRDRAHREFMRHIIIGPYRTVTTPLGRLPWSEHETANELFSATRIMDIANSRPFAHGDPYGHSYLRAFSSAHHRSSLTAVRTLRGRPDLLDARGLPPCEELVIFSDPSRFHREWPAFSFPAKVASKRLVISLVYEPLQWGGWDLRLGHVLDLSSIPPQVVVVVNVHVRPASSFRLTRSVSEYNSLVRRLGEWMARGGSRFTFVGIQAVLCTQLPCPNCSHLAAFKRHLWDAVSQHAQRWIVDPEKAVEEAQHSATFLTLAQYHDRVGSEQFHLHTQYPPSPYS